MAICLYRSTQRLWRKTLVANGRKPLAAVAARRTDETPALCQANAVSEWLISLRRYSSWAFFSRTLSASGRSLSSFSWAKTLVPASISAEAIIRNTEGTSSLRQFGRSYGTNHSLPDFTLAETPSSAALARLSAGHGSA